MEQDLSAQDLGALAAALVPRVIDEMRQLILISTPSGDTKGAERAIAFCGDALPGWALQRLPCSTSTCAPDMLATLTGVGTRQVLFLGHVDTVVGHAYHRAACQDGGRLYGSGAADMKGGVAIALAVARACAELTQHFAQLAVLLVCDEEWRMAPFRHVERFTGYDACLCFEAGEVDKRGRDCVITRRKGAGTLRVRATGRAAHSGSAPENGRNALLALANTAIEVAAASDPRGEHQLTVVPTVMRAGDTFNVVPASGELVCDMRASDTGAFARVLEALPAEVVGVSLEPILERVWPAMDSKVATAPLLVAAAELLGRPIVAGARGGASDASHFAPTIPLTIDGLGPRGGGAHSPEEFAHLGSLGDRIAVALSVARAAILSA